MNTHLLVTPGCWDVSQCIESDRAGSRHAVTAFLVLKARSMGTVSVSILQARRRKAMEFKLC